jgi:hypothetical protein
MPTESYFTNIQQVNNIQQEILKHFFLAKESICIAVPWFTDNEILSVLSLKAKTGIKVEIIILLDTKINTLDFSKFIKYGGKLYIIDDSNGKQTLHSKFSIIDNEFVITGSFNFTYKAQRNLENIDIHFNETKTAQQYNEYFLSIKKIATSSSIPPYEPKRQSFILPADNQIQEQDILMKWWLELPDIWKERLSNKYRGELYMKDGEHITINSFFLNFIVNITSLAMLDSSVPTSKNDRKYISLAPILQLNNLETLYFCGFIINNFLDLANTNIENISFHLCTIKSIQDLIFLKRLKNLSFDNCDYFFDFSEIIEYKSLTHLRFSSCDLSSINGIDTLKDLEDLNISNTPVSDIEPLLSLKNLKILDIQNTNIPKNDYLYYQKENPNCKIITNEEEHKKWLKEQFLMYRLLKE